MLEESSQLFKSFCDYYSIRLFNKFNNNTEKQASETPNPLPSDAKNQIENLTENSNSDFSDNKTSDDKQYENVKEDIIKEQNYGNLNLNKEVEKKGELIIKENKEQEKLEKIEAKDFKANEDFDKTNKKASKDLPRSLSLSSILAAVGVISGFGFYCYLKYKK